MPLRILLIDTEAAAARLSQALAAFPEVALEVADDVVTAVERLRTGEPQTVLIGHAPPGWDGLKVAETLRRIDTDVPLVIRADSIDVRTTTEFLRRGVVDVLVEPVANDDLREAVERCRVLHAKREATPDLAPSPPPPRPFVDFVGSGPALQKVFTRIEQVATTDVDVLIIGETGTGKELVARSIHDRSRRGNRPFVAVDCGAIPENLLESEFFGHERGAFTGADARRIGLLEHADGGTFFLDEVGELPLLLQAKLLRTLQERKLRRVGAREEISIDVRVIAATARNLEQMIREKTFREDLFYRINVVRIDLPPLRARGDDLGLLIEHFAQRYSREMGKAVVGITPEAYQVLAHYRWPGNVRELQNVIRRGIALTHGTMISLDDLPDEIVESAGLNEAESSSIGTATGFFAERERFVEKFERDYLSNLLRKHQGNVKSAAIEAGLPRGTLYRLMKNHGLDGDQFR